MVVQIIYRYRLTQDALRRYLQEKFPTTAINVQERDDDTYAVELPSRLSQDQQDEIEKLRT